MSTSVVKRWPRRLLLAVLAVVLVVGGLFAWRVWHLPAIPPPPDVPVGHLEQEVALVISAARDKVQKSPRSADAWGFLGKVLLAHHFVEQAGVCFRQAEELDAGNPRWPHFRGLVILKDDPDGAIACFRRAAQRCDKSEPDVTTPHLQLAYLLFQENRPEEAEEVLQVLRDKEPNDPNVLYLAALLAIQRGELAQADPLLRRIIESPFVRQKACSKLAWLCQRLGDPAAAQRYDKRSRELPGDSPWPDSYGAEVLDLEVGTNKRFDEVMRLQKEGRLNEAITALERMIANNDPDPGRTYQMLGSTLAHVRRYADAERALRQGLHLVPQDTESHYLLAVVLVRQADELQHNPAEQKAAQGKLRAAIASARAALKINSALVEAHLLVGRTLLRLNERQEGLAELRKCLTYRPEMPQAHLALGEALAEEGKFTDARHHLELAVRFAARNDPQPREALKRFLERDEKEKK